MKYLAPYILEYIGINILQPYYLIVVPRLVMVSLSFISDIFIYKICDRNVIRPWSTLKIWSSSYVVLIFLSRTFSNSYEMALFSVLLYFVSDAMNLTDQFIKREVELLDEYKKANYAVERVRIYKKQREIPLHNYNHSPWIGAVFALGVFNRPTFMLYALVPMYFWVQRGMFMKKSRLRDFHHRLLSLIPTFSIVSFILVLTDSVFYGTIKTLAAIKTLSISNLVIAPVNFVAYNMDQANLAHHGLHPWYLHSAVNIPLLFNVMGIGGLFLMSRAIVVLTLSAWHNKPDLFNFNGLLVFSFAFPLITLSFTPHQEPRFLIPLLIPLVLLLGPFILRAEGFFGKSLRSFWYAANVVCALFFGFFHQGGIFDAQNFMHQHIQQRPVLTHTHILYVHTYMPPISLLAIPYLNTPLVNENGTKYRKTQTVFIEDLAGASLPDLMKRFTEISQDARQKLKDKKVKSEIYAVIPATLAETIENIFKHHPTFQLELIRRSYPHLSMEDPPHFSDLCTQSSNQASCRSLLPWLRNKLSQLYLNIYKLHYPLR